MARLTARDRRRIPKSEFGIPGKRAYPMPDRSHAGNAKARASEMEHKGRISKSTEDKIDAKADRILGEGGNMKHEEKKGKKEDGMREKHRREIEEMKSRHEREKRMGDKKVEKHESARDRKEEERKGEAKPKERKGEERPEAKKMSRERYERPGDMSLADRQKEAKDRAERLRKK